MDQEDERTLGKHFERDLCKGFGALSHKRRESYKIYPSAIYSTFLLPKVEGRVAAYCPMNGGRFFMHILILLFLVFYYSVVRTIRCRNQYFPIFAILKP